MAAGEAANNGSLGSPGNPRNERDDQERESTEGKACMEGETHGHHVPIQLIQALWEANILAVGTLERKAKGEMKSNSIPFCSVIM